MSHQGPLVLKATWCVSWSDTGSAGRSTCPKCPDSHAHVLLVPFKRCYSHEALLLSLQGKPPSGAPVHECPATQAVEGESRRRFGQGRGAFTRKHHLLAVMCLPEGKL